MASKRHVRRKSCTGKETYDRLSALSRAHRVRQNTREWVVAYRCQFGNHWHVGHATAKAKAFARGEAG